MRKISLLFLAMFMALFVNGQLNSFEIMTEPLNVPGLGGLQSYVHGQHNGKWLIIGGRLDGLHRRQPWASFDAAGNNNLLTVVDPISKQVWIDSLSSLPNSIAEQLSSTNMQFEQEGKYLYIIGGYGYSNSSLDHITYNTLTAVDVSGTINAIINGTTLSPHFRQISDPKFAITGGQLNKIYNKYYLVGGHKFDGAYNPHGNPTFTQVYTDQIRSFTISDTGTSILINHYPDITDTANLHRRDYNLLPQILPNGEQGLTAFSGVFKPVVDLPYLNSVDIDSSGYYVNNLFSQYYNHYHCANLAIYDGDNNEMHNLFFGGIAQYYDSAGVMIQDDNVPFVKTIANVRRDAFGIMSESKLPIEMPGYLGASSEFIPNENLAYFSNGVLSLDSLPFDTSLVGYIYGGINSSADNIFWINTGSESIASNTIFKVYLVKNIPAGINNIGIDNSNLNLSITSLNNIITFEFTLSRASNVSVIIYDLNGKLIVDDRINRVFTKGLNSLNYSIKDTVLSGMYLIGIKTSNGRQVKKLILD